MLDFTCNDEAAVLIQTNGLMLNSIIVHFMPQKETEIENRVVMFTFTTP
jgi:hypothetical protein